MTFLPILDCELQSAPNQLMRSARWVPVSKKEKRAAKV
jgi:hypothetical protein